jgi:ATP-dependent Clp protease ATP-binding subunit ClpA
MKWLKTLLKAIAGQKDRPLSNFTPRAQQVLAVARQEADRLNHNYLGTEHLLLGLAALGKGVAVNVLQRMSIYLETLQLEVEKQTGKGPDQKMIGNIPYTPRVKKVLDLARREAKNLNHTYVGTEHLLLALLREDDGIAAQVLKNLDVNLEQARIEVLKELDPNINLDEHAVEKRLELNKPQKELFEELTGFTPRAMETLALARKEADRLRLNYLGTEHLLFGLIELGGAGVATNMLIKQGMNLENVRAEVETLARGPYEKMFRKTYTPRVNRVIKWAKEEAKTLNHTYIGTEHLLLGLLRESEGPAAEVFKKFKVDMEQLRKDLLNELKPPGDDARKNS